jgi:hypothetical protein
MTRILLFVWLWSTVGLLSDNLSQAISRDVQPSPLVRLTGVLTAEDTPPPAGVPTVRVWLGERVWRFQLSTVEPVVPAYRAWEQLRKVSLQGLRWLVEGEALAQLEQAAV